VRRELGSLAAKESSIIGSSGQAEVASGRIMVDAKCISGDRISVSARSSCVGYFFASLPDGVLLDEEVVMVHLYQQVSVAMGTFFPRAVSLKDPVEKRSVDPGGFRPVRYRLLAQFLPPEEWTGSLSNVTDSVIKKAQASIRT